MKRFSKIAICLCVMMFCFVFGTISMTSAMASNETITVEDARFYMVAGASIRCETDDKTQNGLRFSTVMDVEDYTKLKANTDYSSVEFGVLVMPKDYVEVYGELTKATVFGVGGTQVYDYAELVNGEWVYNGSLTQIMNFSSDRLADCETDGFVKMNGSIINLKDGTDGATNNIARKFISTSYIKYVKNGETDYRFAENAYSLNEEEVIGAIGDNCTRSMAEVAFLATNDTGNNEEDVISFVKNNYLNKVNDAVTLGGDYVTEYQVGSTVALPTPTLDFLGEDTTKYCEWSVEKDDQTVTIDNNSVTLDEVGEYTLKLSAKSGDKNTVASYKINSVLLPTYATASSANTIFTYSDTIKYKTYEGAEKTQWNCLGVEIAAGDSVTINKVFELPASIPESADSSLMFYFGLDDWDLTQYQGKQLLITVTSAKDSSKFFTILVNVNDNNQIVIYVKNGDVATLSSYDYTVNTRTYTSVKNNGMDCSICSIYMGKNGLGFLNAANAKVSFNIENFVNDYSTYVVSMSSTTGNNVDFAKINNSGEDDFKVSPNTTIDTTLTGAPLFGEYKVDTEYTLPTAKVVAAGKDISSSCAWEVAVGDATINDGKVKFNTEGSYTLNIVAYGTVIKSYTFNASNTPAYATASSANTVITYNDATFERDNNCLGVTLAAGDSITINKIFALASNLPENAGSTAHRLLFFSLDDWTLDQYQGKKLLITITSAKDGSKFFTLLVTVLSNGRIVICVKNGGVATSSSYDKSVTTISYTSGIVSGASYEMCQIYMGQNGLAFLRPDWGRDYYDIDNFVTDFSEYVVSMSSTTGFEIDFAKINYDTAWSID